VLLAGMDGVSTAVLVDVGLEEAVAVAVVVAVAVDEADGLGVALAAAATAALDGPLNPTRMTEAPTASAPAVKPETPRPWTAVQLTFSDRSKTCSIPSVIRQPGSQIPR
jgi:hypothetical protein